MAADKLSFFLAEWEKCDPVGFASRAEKPETVLETIARVRLADVAAAAAALPLEELKAKVKEMCPNVDASTKARDEIVKSLNTVAVSQDYALSEP